MGDQIICGKIKYDIYCKADRSLYTCKFYILGDRLHDFDILVSFQYAAPPASPNDVYKLCNHYNGTVPNATTVEVKCERSNALGQFVYVVVRRKQAQEYFCVCEVEVYGRFIMTSNDSLFDFD